MKRIILALFLTPLVLNAQIKEYFGKSYEIGSSLTYMTDGENPGPYYDQQLTWNMNAKMRLSKLFWFGLQVAPIFTKQFSGGLSSKTNYNFYGLFGQFDVYSGALGQIYIETSINKSNMLNDLTKLFPTLQNNINYWGFGGGANILLNKKKAKNLYLELAFFNYHVLNKIENKSNYTQYILGLNYRFGKKE